MIESDNALPVGLKAQLLRHGIGIDNYLFGPEIFRPSSLAIAKVALKNFEDHTHSKQ